jgi:formate/nitrite transporter FocA (FNT family)
MGKDFGSKVMGVWWPSFAFVSLGFDHVVVSVPLSPSPCALLKYRFLQANMWFISNGIRHGAPGISVGLYIWKGMVPAGLGNIVGGGLFVATILWYLHIFQEPPVEIMGENHASSSESTDNVSQEGKGDTRFLKSGGKTTIQAREVV